MGAGSLQGAPHRVSPLSPVGRWVWVCLPRRLVLGSCVRRVVRLILPARLGVRRSNFVDAGCAGGRDTGFGALPLRCLALLGRAVLVVRLGLAADVGQVLACGVVYLRTMAAESRGNLRRVVDERIALDFDFDLWEVVSSASADNSSMTYLFTRTGSALDDTVVPFLPLRKDVVAVGRRLRPALRVVFSAPPSISISLILAVDGLRFTLVHLLLLRTGKLRIILFLLLGRRPVADIEGRFRIRAGRSTFHSIALDVTLNHGLLAGLEFPDLLHPLRSAAVLRACHCASAGPLPMDRVHATAEGKEGDGEAVHEDRAEHHERDDRLDARGEHLRLPLRWRVRVRELLRSERGDEDRPDANRPEVPGEYRFPEGLHVRDPSVEGHHDRQAPEDEYEDTDDDKPPGGDAESRVVEFGKGHPCAYVDERGDVEEEVDNRREHRFFGLAVEETVPCEGGSACECCE
jgi:hypothetical protein